MERYLCRYVCIWKAVRREFCQVPRQSLNAGEVRDAIGDKYRIKLSLDKWQRAATDDAVMARQGTYSWAVQYVQYVVTHFDLGTLLPLDILRKGVVWIDSVMSTKYRGSEHQRHEPGRCAMPNHVGVG